MGIWQKRGLVRAELSQIGWDFDNAGHAADRMQVLTRHSLAWDAADVRDFKGGNVTDRQNASVDQTRSGWDAVDIRRFKGGNVTDRMQVLIRQSLAEMLLTSDISKVEMWLTDRMKVLIRNSLAEMLLMLDISEHIEILLNINDRYWYLMNMMNSVVFS